MTFNQFKNNIKTFILALLVVTPGFALTHHISPFLINSNIDQNILTVSLTETQTSPHNCNLVLTRLEFLPDLKILNIEVKETEFCPLDVIGARKALIQWQLPFGMRNKGNITLRVNNKILKKIYWPEENLKY